MAQHSESRGGGAGGESGGAGRAAIREVVRSLTLLRARVRALLVTQRVALVLAAVLGAALVIGAADYVLRTPPWLRLALWAAGVSAVLWAIVRVIGPAFWFRPRLSELALRVERGPAGHKAGLQGVLTAGVELAAARERGDLDEVSASLAEPVVAAAARGYAQVRARDILSGTLLWRSAGLLGAAAAVLLLLTALTPALVGIGASRIFAPWSSAQWPKRTAVADVTEHTVHPLGEALALRAVVARRGLAPEAASSSRVWGMYRFIDADGRAGPTRTVLLTSQDRAADMPGAEDAAGDESIIPARGTLFERLIEPGALTEKDRREGTLEYWFHTEDDQTPVASVRLVEPPAVVSASAEITPPAYAASAGIAAALNDAGDDSQSRALDLGPGNDERAAPPTLLAGSRIRVNVRLNKSVPAPAADDTDARRAWLAASVGEDIAALADAQALWSQFDGSTWQLEWVLRETTRIPVRITDEFGLASVEEAVYRFEAATDGPPTATVTEPESDRTVLPTATIDVIGEGRDDVALAWVALERRKASRPTGSEGAPAEPVEEWGPLARVETSAAAPSPDGTTESTGAAAARQSVVAARLDLAEYGLRAGDELWLSALAADFFELDGERHEPVRSGVRRLVVISDEEFAAQILAELGSLRRAAVRLDEEQQRLGRAMAPGTELGADGAEQNRRGQAGITERLAREREAIARVQRRMEENRFSDAELDALVTEAGSLLEEAGERSVEASGAVEEVARAEEAGEGATESQRAQAAAEQNDVRDTLGELADLLDQGRDTWALRRSIERALEEQRALRERTSNTSGKTAGKGQSELSPQESADLQQIATEQEELAQRTAEALQQMQERLEELRENDPAAAKAVEQAAQRGQQEQVPNRMQEAAEQTRQNQGNSAVSQQDRAIQSLEQMLEDLDQGAATRDEELRRLLADLIGSIERLVEDQQAQLAALEAARANQAFGPLAEPMVRLNQNTLAVLDEVNNAPRELAPVAEQIDRAVDAQGAAIRSLRAEAVNADEAQAQETLSLERLQKALEEAQRLDEEAADREAERKAAALKKAYREALTEQVDIEAQTAPLAGQEATRRTRAVARQLGERQTAVRQQLADLKAQTQELSDALMFSYAHERLDKLMTEAAATLAQGAPDRMVLARQQSSIRILQSLIEALDNRREKDDDFRENPQGEGDGGGGSGGPTPLIPPIAELRLLRAMQIEATEMTRLAGELGDAAASDDAATLQADLAAKAAVLLETMMNSQGGDAGGAQPGAGGGGPQ